MQTIALKNETYFVKYNELMMLFKKRVWPYAKKARAKNALSTKYTFKQRRRHVGGGGQEGLCAQTTVCVSLFGVTLKSFVFLGTPQTTRQLAIKK